jgi:hypothetical protein
MMNTERKALLQAGGRITALEAENDALKAELAEFKELYDGELELREKAEARVATYEEEIDTNPTALRCEECGGRTDPHLPEPWRGSCDCKMGPTLARKEAP